MTTKPICPACKKHLSSPKAMPKHVSGCPKWDDVIGVPPSKFNFEKHFGRGLFDPALIEGENYVSCRVCSEAGRDLRKRRLTGHLRTQHALTVVAYLEAYPGAPVRLKGTTARRIATTRAKHGVDNVFQLEDVKEKSKATSLKKYGVENAGRSAGAEAKRAATNLDRYGHENPFGSSVVQERIRETSLDRYGVENPGQSSEAQERRKQTNLERYGVEHYMETEEFQEKFKDTSRENWGADHPMQSEEGREAFIETCQAIYGVDFPVQSPEVQAKAYATNLRNHGGKHSQKDPKVRAKAIATWLEKYGVDNPSKDPVIKAKIIDRIKERFGSGAIPKMTSPERIVDEATSDTILYTGAWSYWVVWASKRRKNPDFVVLTPAQLRAYRAGVPLTDLAIRKVVEVNGLWWHTDYIGVTREERETEFVDGYASVGVQCIVIWDDELGDVREIKQRLEG